ncbi:hypothetical protein BpHYR1_051967 [Brachionus plicatilis]|uniref:Uncharacterized protein n=1 Tax=Brachionus plicatilis TaxID=10195 RepID=A0A3M7SCN8_BRAPC|nr:hypothetical protein BpHYR1_051967 [Brachionus plicatilis]
MSLEIIYYNVDYQDLDAFFVQLNTLCISRQLKSNFRDQIWVLTQFVSADKNLFYHKYLYLAFKIKNKI